LPIPKRNTKLSLLGSLGVEDSMRFRSIGAGVLLAAIPANVGAECAMVLTQRHIDPAQTPILASRTGVPALHFNADIDVNTDGASRSYHPADPQGRSLALNNIVNAITGAKEADGTPIACAPKRGACFMRYIRAFERARDSRWATSGAPQVSTRYIIPWRMDPALGRRVPCTIASGPFAGFFVSQTSFIVDPSKSECSQDRYLDAMAFNAAVLPGGVNWSSQDRRAAIGDLVVVRAPATGRIAYAILGDAGPRKSIGEVTIALAAQLRGQTVPANASYQQIRALALRDGQYLIFPGTDVRRSIPGAVSQSEIDRLGREIFQRWGGEARLAQCAR
jgi:hypothetical protein